MYELRSTERQRFNDGFWDGIDTRERPNRIATFEGIRNAIAGRFTYDPLWAEGVRAGYQWQGGKPETSDPAWRERQDARKAAAAERKRIREARPSRVILY